MGFLETEGGEHPIRPCCNRRCRWVRIRPGNIDWGMGVFAASRIWAGRKKGLHTSYGFKRVFGDMIRLGQ